LLRLRPAKADDQRTAGNRAAERRRYSKWQARFDRALGIIDELLSGILVALEMGEGDAWLAEDRAVTLQSRSMRSAG
jgi:hypothetical protein